MSLMKNIPILFKKHPSSVPLAIILTAYFFFGLQHIGSFITADEHYWVEERIPQYWEAWDEGKWKKTLINDKPGVSLALVSAPALLFHGDTMLSCQEKEGWFSGCDPEETSWLYASFRLPILVTNALLLVLIFFSVRTFAGRFVATAATGLMALSPHLLGMSQIVNPDSLLWSTGSAGIFAFLAFLRTGRKSFAIWTIVALTLALLSKYTAIIAIFFLPLIALSIRFLDPGFSPIPPKKKLASLIAISLSPFLLFLVFVPGVFSSEERITAFLTAGTGSFLPWVGYAALVGVLAITAFLRIPKRIGTIIRNLIDISLRMLAVIFVALVLAFLAGRALYPSWDIFTAIPFDIKDLSNARYYFAEALSPIDIAFIEVSPLAYGLPLATLGFALFAIVFAAVSRKREGLPVTLVLTLFIVLHLAALGFSNVFAIPRYIILAFPISAFLAALGMKEAWELVPKRHRTGKRAAIALAIVTAVLLASLFLSKPYYVNFANGLLPERSLIAHSWGYGGYEAAMHLNTLPDAKHLTVWSDYYGFCEFFVGRCLTAYTFDPAIDPDYYVLTYRGEARYMSRYDRWEEKSGLRAYQYYDRTDPVWELDINGKKGNFVKVFRVDKEFRASIVTDIDHCPSREAVSESNLDSFIGSSRETQSDFIVSLGDNASHRLRDCSRTGDADVRHIADRLRSSGLPTHFVLGDHDIASSVASYRAWMETTGRDKTYYSFDKKGVHVVILDTVLGGDVLRDSCTDDPECSLFEARLADMKTLPFAEYQEKYPDAEPSRWQEDRSIRSLLEQEKRGIALTRSFGNRDRGRVSEEELEWLKQGLADTTSDRVVVFSDHPLFPFVSNKKSYDIVGGELVREVLETSGKEVVAISGEAHLWHEETLNGIRYFIIDQFKEAGGSWAHISWDEDGFEFERIVSQR